MRTTLHTITVDDAIARCTTAGPYQWTLPREVQPPPIHRQQILDTLDAVWRGIPIGAITLAAAPRSQPYAPAAHPVDGVPAEPFAIIDGIPMLTALCLLTGLQPTWHSPHQQQRYDTRLVLDVRRQRIYTADPDCPTAFIHAWDCVDLLTVLHPDGIPTLDQAIAEDPHGPLARISRARAARLLERAQDVLETRIPVLVAVGNPDDTEELTRLYNDHSTDDDAQISRHIATPQNRWRP